MLSLRAGSRVGRSGIGCCVRLSHSLWVSCDSGYKYFSDKYR